MWCFNDKAGEEGKALKEIKNSLFSGKILHVGNQNQKII